MDDTEIKDINVAIKLNHLKACAYVNMCMCLGLPLCEYLP